MIKIIKKILLATFAMMLFAACTSNTDNQVNLSKCNIDSLSTQFVLFDSDGDGIKDDIAELKMLGASGGYGSFELEVFISDENNYIKIFDDNGAINVGEALEFLSSILDCEVQVDSVYSVEAVDTDNDGCDELICRQYVWSETHSNHIGDLVTIVRITGQTVELVERMFEKE